MGEADVVPDFCLAEQDRVSVIPLPRHFRERGYWMYAHTDRSRWSPAIERFVHFVSPPPPPRNQDGRFPGIDEDGTGADAAIGVTGRHRASTEHPALFVTD